MAELLSAGVYIEEVPDQVQVVQAVSTSTLGAVGFTPRGPSDKATFVGSFEDFVKNFGDISPKSFLGLNVAAFFANGGRRAYIARVMPSDAVLATGQIRSLTTGQDLGETPDGAVVTFSKSNAASVLKDNTGASPIIGKSATLKWRPAAAASVTVNTKKRDGATNLTGDGALTKFEGRLDPADLGAGLFTNNLPNDPLLHVVVSAVDVVLTWAVGAQNKTLTFLGATAGDVVSASNADGSGIFDRRSGFFSLSTAAAVDNAAVVKGSYTKVGTTLTLTDDGAGNLTGAGTIDGAYANTVNGIGPNQISYLGGGYNFKVLANKQPHNGAKVYATYTIAAWTMVPVSKGKWANSLRVNVHGASDFYSTSSASYSKHNVVVQMKNAATGVYETFEHFDEVVFDDPTSGVFAPDVVNDLSDFLDITTPGGNEAPGELSGIARAVVVAGGDESAGGQTITVTLPSVPIAARSLTISFTDNTGAAKTITDDGLGKLVGAIDATGANTINYATGALAVKLVNPAKVGTLVIATFRTAPAENNHVEDFGDIAKDYVAGTDGTFTANTYGRSQFTDSALLKASKKGLYALDTVDDILQVIVPDFAGDVTVTGDILDYVDGRALLPAGADRFAILTVPKGSSAQGAADWFRFTLKRYSKFAALYWPWVKVANPNANNRSLVLPPLGHLAGIYARTDATRNVGKAPGGLTDGALKFLLDLEVTPTLADRDLVYQNKVNPLVSSVRTGTAVWGVRTIAIESAWRYINVRRLFMFLEQSVFNSTHWIVFENNGPALWDRINTQLSGFLGGLFVEGYFAGNSPAEAFFVKVDETNNTQITIDQGQVIIDIGVAPQKPAEFIRFRFQQKSLT